MRILAVSDVESKRFYDFYRPGRLAGFDLILSCGDLHPEYLEFLVTMANCPLLYVHGNHDDRYDHEPGGCVCVDDRVYTCKGLRVVGLGGSYKYRDGKYMYTERDMKRRLFRLGVPLRRSKGFDILLTHAPARGVGDMEDVPHRGFEAFLALMDRWHPRFLVYGHVHQEYGALGFVRERQYGETTCVNAYKRYVIEF